MSVLEVWTPMSPEGFELCNPREQEEFERIILEVNGKSRKMSWRPPIMDVIREDEGHRLTESDSPWLGSHALIFRPDAVAAMGEVLARHGELLPLDCGGAEVVMLNVTTVLDALDEEQSSVMRFSGRRIMMVKNYVFHPQVIGDADVFKIPNLRGSPTFVSKRFVDDWQGHDLRGLEFKRVF